MASVKNEDIPDIFEFMADVWRFMKCFWIPEDNKEYWDGAACAARELMDRHEDDFCVAFVCFILGYLKWKRRKDSGQTGLDFNTWLHIERAEMAESKRQDIKMENMRGNG